MRVDRARLTAPGWALSGLAALTLIRLWVAAVTPLVPDEAYYWVWSRTLAAGYLDHPPMVALWIRAGTALIGASPLGVRLPGPVSAALGTLLVHDAAERMFPGRRAGLTAALLLNATLIIGAGAVIMTPDTPLLFFWTLTLWAAARLAAGGSPRWWLAAGAGAGLALVSKYTAAFLPVGLGLFLLIAKPAHIRRLEPWAGLLLAVALFSPVILWNADHAWAGFLRQGGRVGDWHPARAATFLAELVFGQIGLATPGVFVLCAAGMTISARKTVRGRAPAWTLLAAFTIPAILVFFQHAVGDRVQGNWPAILWPAAVVAAAGLDADRWRRWIGPSVSFGLGVTALVYAHAVIGWPVGLPIDRFAAADPLARQMAGWDSLATDVEAARQTSGAAFVVAEPYGLAAELAWSGPPGAGPVLGLGPHWALTGLAHGEGEGAPILLVWPARRDDAPDPAVWRDVRSLPALARRAGGIAVERYTLFTARSVGSFPAAHLPRRGE